MAAKYFAEELAQNLQKNVPFIASTAHIGCVMLKRKRIVVMRSRLSISLVMARPILPRGSVYVIGRDRAVLA